MGHDDRIVLPKGNADYSSTHPLMLKERHNTVGIMGSFFFFFTLEIRCTIDGIMF